MKKTTRNCFFVMATEYMEKKKNVKYSDAHHTIEYWPNEDEMHVLARFNVAEHVVKFTDGSWTNIDDIDQKSFNKKLNSILSQISACEKRLKKNMAIIKENL